MLVYVLTALFALMQLIILFVPLAAGARVRPNIAPLVAIAILWANQLAFRRAGGGSVMGVILWILFAVTAFVALTPTILALFSPADRPRSEAPLDFGPVRSPKSLAIVYHSGASGFARGIDSRLAASLAKEGIGTTIYTARPGLGLELGKVSALCLSSPVYLGEIRPPVMAFIAATDLRGVKCVAVLTGWIGTPEVERQDLAKMRKLIEAKGGIFLGGKKFGSFLPPKDTDIEAFAEKLGEIL